MRYWLALVLVMGCDSDDESRPSDELTARAWYDGYAEAQCERALRCGTSSDSVETCLATYEAAAEPKRSRFVGAIEAGTMALSQAKANECLQLMAGACGDDLTRVLPVCNDATSGAVALGGACFAHAQCSDAEAERPYCFEGCVGLFGEEEPEGHGTCVATSPIGTAACP